MARLIIGSVLILFWLIMVLPQLFGARMNLQSILSLALGMSGFLVVPGIYLLIGWNKRRHGLKVRKGFLYFLTAFGLVILGIVVNPSDKGRLDGPENWHPGLAIIEMKLSGDNASMVIEDITTEPILLGKMGPLRMRTKRFAVQPGYHVLQAKTKFGYRTVTFDAPPDTLTPVLISLKRQDSKKTGLRTITTFWTMDASVGDPVPYFPQK